MCEYSNDRHSTEQNSCGEYRAHAADNNKRESLLGHCNEYDVVDSPL